MPEKLKALLATRAIESPPQEGGYVLLSDLAKDLANDSRITTAMFSATKNKLTYTASERVFTKPGWDSRIRLEFMLGLFKKAHKYDLVHTAHIPTSLNSVLMRLATSRARRAGTKFVQTVTGLPRTDIRIRELNKLLWGDFIVCQSQSVFDKVSQLHKPTALITPWPSYERIAYDETRRETMRDKHFPGVDNIVVFPGEFDRLGVDSSFSDCLQAFLQNTKNSVVVLACRFDRSGTGSLLASKFPKQVLSVGTTEEIIPLLEAADLTIYPVKKMDSKFQPPLVLIESLQLGTPILASTKVDIDRSVSDLVHLQNPDKGWRAFGLEMARIINMPKKQRTGLDASPFKRMVSAYRKIYLEATKSND